MYSSNSVLRRYTPPTCTLEIVANGSPLSGWFGRPLLKQLKFQLNLDDPRMPEEKKVTVRGDKTQLDRLSTAVQTYVQEFLDRSPAEFDRSLLSAAVTDPYQLSDSDAEPIDHFADTPTVTLEMSRFQSPVVEQGDPNYPSDRPTTDSTSSDTPDLLSEAKQPPENSVQLLPTSQAGIYLQPKGLLSHHLYLGSLATPESGPLIRLTLLQLFDLATALDSYASDVEVLPNLARPARSPFPVWAGIAAILLVTVGVTTAVVKVQERKTSPPDTVASTANSQVKPKDPPPIAATLSPEATPGVPTPPATSPQTLPALPSSAASVTPTPSATPPVTPSLGATPPVGAIATPPPNSIGPLTAKASPNPTTSSTPSASDTYKLPVNSAASPSNNTNQAPPQNPRDNRAAVQILPSQTTAPQQVRQQPKPKQPPTVVPPPLTPPAMEVPPPLTPPPATSQNVLPPPAAQIASQPTPRRQVRPSPNSVATPTASPTPVASAEIYSLPPQRGETADTPGTPASENISENSPRPNISLTPETPVAASGEATANRPSPISSPAAQRSNNTLFDTIPQVAQARNYFQTRWRPPSSLEQPLEYNLVLNADGTIRQIKPLGEAAKVYLDRTEMPLLGEAFVSPVDGKRSPTIRLILEPDGKVQTHLQSLD